MYLLITKEKNIGGFLMITVIFLCLILIIHSCKHEPSIVNAPTDPDPDPDPDPNVTNVCHPDTVYFNKEILPFLGASCGRVGCHDAGTQQDGVRLTDYESVVQTADVRPGRPDKSDLYEVLVDDDPDDRMPPPPNEPLLPEQIERIRVWILQGAQNLDCDDGDCNLDNVTFSNNVSAILAQNGCVSCHSGSSPNGGIQLDTYTSVRQVAESGRLMGAIQHDTGFVPMPLNGNKIDTCQIDQIQQWIDNGMQND